MFSLEVVQKPTFSYDEKLLDNILKIISHAIKKEQKGILNIIFIDEESIQNLNKKYRNKDTSTDVLSFHYYDEFSALQDDEIAGEIVFCEEKVIMQGKEYGLGVEKEFYKLLIHSILHILGYDHEEDEAYEEMQKEEDTIWNQVFG